MWGWVAENWWWAHYVILVGFPSLLVIGLAFTLPWVTIRNRVWSSSWMLWHRTYNRSRRRWKNFRVTMYLVYMELEMSLPTDGSSDPY